MTSLQKNSSLDDKTCLELNFTNGFNYLVLGLSIKSEIITYSYGYFLECFLNYH